MKLYFIVIVKLKNINLFVHFYLNDEIILMILILISDIKWNRDNGKAKEPLASCEVRSGGE